MNPKEKGRGISDNPPSRFEGRQYVRDPEFLEREYRHEIPGPIRTRLLAVFPKTVVNPVKSPDLPMKFSLNPYQGCEHGCAYGYARPTHSYWGYSPGLDFESTILYKPSAPELLRTTLTARSWKPETVVLSGNTDCYQPVERRLRLTRKCLEVFLAYRNPCGVITKNSLVLRDKELLKDLTDLGLVQVHISLTTRDEGLRRVLEPRTASHEKRIAVIRELSSLGIPVSAIIAPIIPGLNGQEIIPMAEEAALNGARGLSGVLIRLNGEMGEVFSRWIRESLPGVADRVLNQIRACHEGRLSESRFGVRAKGSGPVAAQLQQAIQLARFRYFSDKALPKLRKDLFLWKDGPGRTDQLRLFPE